MRAPTRCAVIIVLAGVACGDPTVGPTGSGGLALSISAASANLVPLDSGHVVLSGPTNRTVRVTPGQSTTITGLLPGSYTVVLRGFDDDAIDYFGTTSAMVVAGQNTAASVSFASFVPVLNQLANDTTRTFTVPFGNVTNAASYEVEAATDVAFTANRVAVTSTGTSAQVTVPTYGRKFVRVRAIDPQGGRGRPAATRTIYIAQLDQAHVPASFTLFAGGNTHKSQTFTVGRSGVLTHIDIYIVFAGVDMLFDVRATAAGVPVESDATTLYAEVIPSARITSSTYYTFPLGPNGIAVTAGQVFAFVMRPNGTASFQWNGTNTNAYPGGVWRYRNPGAGVNVWTVSDANFDMAFRTFVSP